MKLILNYKKNIDWEQNVSESISKKVNSCLEQKKRCSFFLTGGNSVKPIYRSWRKKNLWDNSRMDYYFGDERIVHFNNLNSNYYMIKHNLFKGKVPKRCRLNRIKGETKDSRLEIKRYNLLMPESFDIIILSLGSDGHIASLFPEMSLKNLNQNFLITKSKNFSYKRISISPALINRFDNIFLLISGKSKGEVLAKINNQKLSNLYFPFGLINKDIECILDNDAFLSHNKYMLKVTK